MPKMHCHSERSEEFPHFSRYAMVYALAKTLKPAHSHKNLT